MTDLIAASIPITGALALILWLVVKLLGVRDAQATAESRQLDEQRKSDAAIKQRDDALAQNAALKAANADLADRLVGAQHQINALAAKDGQDVADKIANAPTADAGLAALNAELHASHVPDSGAASAGGDGHPAAAAVQPGTAPDAGGHHGQG